MQNTTLKMTRLPGANILTVSPLITNLQNSAKLLWELYPRPCRRAHGSGADATYGFLRCSADNGALILQRSRKQSWGEHLRGQKHRHFCSRVERPQSIPSKHSCRSSSSLTHQARESSRVGFFGCGGQTGTVEGLYGCSTWHRGACLCLHHLQAFVHVFGRLQPTSGCHMDPVAAPSECPGAGAEGMYLKAS